MQQDNTGSTHIKPVGAKRGRRKAIRPFESVFRGHYDLTEFIAKYRLAPLQAREIFERVGPARAALDKYMAAHEGSR
ncbi:hypothetical protein LAC81_37635 (plasmid) [Ensifer adhaerens]|uniref:hypothetical protein n=1 Tax=Ensifer adhaerens TaxID=106592 RepID=UPI001CBCE354|nr:hypothetical protein [Ensifer adhaerens]MBZ7927663.1 hypothetical protein [Ensifer adhaerens]UAX98451.1 hypothetical protein LAC78_38935 [Ensifer adhaerens]UAY05832.1 hypothetical protein LAC80_37650 [Ensifer adhaerens]UAY13208.1 hypothetical protein LAC81_37635 [Ensifer adhaerens]